MKNLASFFRALCGILNNAQANETQQVTVKEKYELVKFNGAAPIVGELKEPIEILNGDDKTQMHVAYTAGAGDNIKLFTGDGNGHAVLAEVKPR